MHIYEVVEVKMSLVREEDFAHKIGIEFLLLNNPISKLPSLCLVCWQLLSQLHFEIKEIGIFSENTVESGC